MTRLCITALMTVTAYRSGLALPPVAPRQLRSCRHPLENPPLGSSAALCLLCGLCADRL